MAAAALMLDNCESVLLCLESQKSVPAPFLTKTYQLVDDPDSDHIVSWSEDTTTFVVWRPPEFARDLLPKYFKHNNFSSFVRQLNTYGFRKIIPDRWEFGNEFFRKGEKHLLSEIHRRKASHLIHQQQQPQQQQQQHYPLNVNGGSGFFSPFTNLVNISPSDSDELLMNRSDSSSPLSSPRDHNNNNNMMNSSSVVLLAEDNERLRLRNSMLMAELAHMKKLYNDIIFFVQNHVKAVPPPANISNSYNPSLPPPSFHGGFNKQQQYRQCFINSSNTTSSTSSLTVVDEGSVPIVNNNTKLFGVNLHEQYPAKKRLHPDQVPTSSQGMTNMSSSSSKVRLVDDLRLNLMSPSAHPCS